MHLYNTTTYNNCGGIPPGRVEPASPTELTCMVMIRG